MQIFYEFIEIIGCLLSYFYLLFVANIFLIYRSKAKKIISILLCSIYLPMTYDFIIPLNNTISSLLAMVFLFMVFLLCFVGSASAKAIIIVVYNIFSICFSNIIYLIASNIMNMPITTLISTRNITRCCIIIFLYLFEFLIILLVKKTYFHKNFTTYDISEFITLFIFILFDFIFALLSYFLIDLKSHNYRIIEFVCLIMCIFCLISTFLVLYLIKLLQKRHEQEFFNMALDIQISNMKSSSAILESKINEMRKFKHDINSQLLIYKTLLTEGKTNVVIDDISNLLNLPIFTNTVVFCSNSVLNSFLNIKNDSAYKNDINFQCRIFLDTEYDNPLFMIVISNLIDNAFEHEITEPLNLRKVSLSIVQNSSGINIIIGNYISQSVLSDNPKLHSTKVNSVDHGFGIQNVKSIVQKFDDLIEFVEENNIFYVQIFLPLIDSDSH